MATEYLVCVLSIFLTGIAQGQKIITSPESVTGIIGGNVTFHCEVEFKYLGEVMTWEHNGHAIYTYQINREEYDINHNKYTVTKDGGNLTLEVQKLEWSDAGIYTCREISPYAEATLIILDMPYLIDSTIDESNIVSFTCMARFGGPSRDQISPHHFPKLRMRSGGKPLPVAVNKSRDKSDHQYYLLWQIYHITPDLEGQMQNTTLTCDISTSNPEKNLSTEIAIEICEKSSSTTRLVTTGNEVTADPRNDPVPGSEEVKVYVSSNTGLVMNAMVLVILILVLCVIGVLFRSKFGSNPSCFKARKKKESDNTELMEFSNVQETEVLKKLNEVLDAGNLLLEIRCHRCSIKKEKFSNVQEKEVLKKSNDVSDAGNLLLEFCCHQCSIEKNADSPDPSQSTQAEVHAVQEAQANNSADAEEQNPFLNKFDMSS